MTLHLRNARAALPPYYAQMVCRITSREFQIVGLPEGIEDRIFPDRQMAEEFLARNLYAIDRILKRGPRACLRCSAEFVSLGRGHRLCTNCKDPSSEKGAQL